MILRLADFMSPAMAHPLALLWPPPWNFAAICATSALLWDRKFIRVTLRFSSVNITYLLDHLEKIITEGFEIAKRFRIEYNEPSSTFQIIMSETIFDKNIEQIIDKKVSKHIGDPLISSIACILSLVTHKIIQIKSIETNTISKETNVTYEIHARE